MLEQVKSVFVIWIRVLLRYYIGHHLSSENEMRLSKHTSSNVLILNKH